MSYTSFSDDLKTVAAIGLTGNGKSALCNRIIGSDVFAESDGADGETMATICQYGVFRVRNGRNRLEVQVIDTPGMGDRHNRDSNHIKQMIDKLRQVQKVNTFFITMNYQCPRLDENTKRLIQLLPTMLPGNSFWKNVMIVFTKTYRPMTTPSQISKKKAEFKKRFSDEFHACLEDIQFVFIDSKDTENADNEQQFQNMFDFVRNARPFATVEARVVDGGLDFEKVARMKELDRQKKEADEKAQKERLKREQEKLEHDKRMRQVAIEREQERQQQERERQQQQQERQQREREREEDRERERQREHERKKEREEREEREERDRQRQQQQQRELDQNLAHWLANLQLAPHQPTQPQFVVVGGGGGGYPWDGMNSYGADFGGGGQHGHHGHHHDAGDYDCGTVYSGRGRPRLTDYQPDGSIRRF